MYAQKGGDKLKGGQLDMSIYVLLSLQAPLEQH